MDLLKFLFLTITRFKNYIRSVVLAFSLKGPKAIPVFGNVLTLKDSQMVETEANNFSIYGPIVRTWVSILPVIWIYEPKHLKIVLGSSRYSEKSIFYRLMHNFLGNGLITNNGKKWKKNRKFIQPYFHLNFLETYIKTFASCAENVTENLKVHEDLNVTSYVNNCMLEVLCRTILGIPLDLESPYRKGNMELRDRITQPWLLLDTIFNLTSRADKENKQKSSLYTYTKDIVLKRLNAPDKSEGCLLDHFLEISRNNPEFTLDDIINQTVTFMLAGQDSVGGTLAFSLYYIAKYGDIQDKILEEIRTIQDQDLSLLTLGNMKFTEQVLKETLRLTPSVPILSRVLTEDVNLDGKIIPEGTTIAMSPFITQRQAHVFKDPLKFDPDRFSDENLEKMDPYAFIPFSLGPRNCIGYKFAMIEMKTILFHLLKKYRFSLADSYTLTLNFRTTLRAKGGIRLNVKLRE